MIRYLLSCTIRTKKLPETKGDILRLALKDFLRHGLRLGLCHSLRKSLRIWAYKNDVPHPSSVFPLFSKEIAISKFNGRDAYYWWSRKDWWHRYKYMKWLIEQYDNEKI